MSRSSIITLCLLLFLFMYDTTIVNVNAGAKPSKQRPRSPPPPTRPPPPPPIPLNPHVWCVAKSGASTKDLSLFLKDACRRLVNCDILKRGQPCYLGGNIRRQASYVLNRLFVDTHNCYARVGTSAYSDPSEGRCIFQMVDLRSVVVQ